MKVNLIKKDEKTMGICKKKVGGALFAFPFSS